MTISIPKLGQNVGLYIDTRTEYIDEGDVIRTQTGRSYRVTAARRQERGAHTGRWHLRATVVDPAAVTNEDRIISIVWYSRRSGKAGSINRA